MTIFGDGLQTRAFSYVGDITGPMVRSLRMPDCFGQTFNIGADQHCTVLELAHEVAGALAIKPHIVHLPARNEIRHAYASHEKVERFFGPQPKTALAEGLRTMAAWVTTVGVREPIRFNNIEVLKNLPPSWL